MAIELKSGSRLVKDADRLNQGPSVKLDCLLIFKGLATV